MIVVYGAAGGGSLEVALGGGHSSIAFTGLGEKSFYMSWVRQGKAALQKYSTGIWGDATYRIELPTEEDGNKGGLSEGRAFMRFLQLCAQGKQRAREMREYLGADNPAAGQWQDKAGMRVMNDFLDLNYSHLYTQYNCVQITKMFLTEAGGYDKLRSFGLPSLTVTGICTDAGNIHYALKQSIRDWSLDYPEGFFADDIYKGKNIIPWLAKGV